ncbi:hypothetical protein KCP78_19930 [Salmonella enterica subsp. enterica]|nr:hypothetical protein KCP78_19930 [Salmonella enterica subsp. enterica]
MPARRCVCSRIRWRLGAPSRYTHLARFKPSGLRGRCVFNDWDSRSIMARRGPGTAGGACRRQAVGSVAMSLMGSDGDLRGDSLQRIDDPHHYQPGRGRSFYRRSR